jgi:iron complex outermembrane receptor protein
MQEPSSPGRAARLAAATGAACALAHAAAAAVPAAPLADLSLEQLRDIVVTTVSRADERLDRAAASVFVIGAEDIRRAGVTSLPEALRLAPALIVAQADANQFAISARGFNNVLANRMLVLIDGRTVYTPLFSGVFWEAQDVMLEDVERIEVVTGPSTALWGSNAVNGLIHVITRRAAATQGTAASLNAGNRRQVAALRHGGTAGDDVHWRAYAKAVERSDTHRADGTSVDDAAHGVQAGFRADWSRSWGGATLQGDAYRGRADQPGASRRDYAGANLLGRWDRRFGSGADASVQGYVEQTRREHPGIFQETRDTVDLVGQYGWQAAAAHRVLVGAGVRWSRDDISQLSVVGFVPPKRTLRWQRAFAQDRIALSESLALTLAASVEHNPYTGTEVLPSARLAWAVDEDRTAWAALSRVVRAPSRVDRDFVRPAQPPFVIAGGPNFESEVSDVLELGWRARHGAALSYSLTAFHHEHRRLRSIAPTPAGLQFENGIEGRTHGLEAWAQWRPMERWRLDGGLALLRSRLRVAPGEVDVGGLALLGNDPRRWLKLRSSFDLADRVQWDVALRHYGALPQPEVPSYTAVDTRLSWRATPTLELALVGRNLFDEGHAEWGPAANRVELERELLLQLRWRL